MICYDFDQDLDQDLVTINTDGIIQFFRNDQMDGFMEVGKPLEAMYTGKLSLMDANNNGSMDITIEIEPGVTKSLEIGDAFGTQMQPVSGKRAIKYALFDHLGTTRMLTNNWGSVTWPHPVRKVNKLLPFGKDLDLDPETYDPVQSAYKQTFTGKELDQKLDLHYYGARYYNATLPRFLSPDPVSGTTENPNSWNKYAYCRNDPINLFDPDGRAWVYAQNTGDLMHVDESSGDVQFFPWAGYAGIGEGLNNPEWQFVPFQGPLPQGEYTIQPIDDRNRMDLEPSENNIMESITKKGVDRDHMQIHWGNLQYTSSWGCICIPNMDLLMQIADSDDRLLHVTNEIYIEKDGPHIQYLYEMHGLHFGADIGVATVKGDLPLFEGKIDVWKFDWFCVTWTSIE